MKDSLLQRFITLVKHDQQINTLERQREDLVQKIEDHEREISVLRDNLADTKKYVHDLRKLIDEKELHMRELDDREKEARRRLDQAKNAREYESFQHEVTSLQKEQVAFEQELLGAWKLFEDTQKTYQEKKAFAAEKTEKLQALIYEQAQKKVGIEENVKRLYQERDEKTEGIANDMLEKYEVMRAKITNPVVPVDRGGCSACFYNIPQQDLMSIRRGVLKQCKMCFRFLYNDGGQGV